MHRAKQQDAKPYKQTNMLTEVNRSTQIFTDLSHCLTSDDSDPGTSVCLAKNCTSKRLIIKSRLSFKKVKNVIHLLTFLRREHETVKTYYFVFYGHLYFNKAQNNWSKLHGDIYLQTDSCVSACVELKTKVGIRVKVKIRLCEKVMNSYVIGRTHVPVILGCAAPLWLNIA